MLPGWIRAAGGGRTIRRQPGQRWRGYPCAAAERKSDRPRHGDSRPDHPDHPVASHCDRHVDSNADEHIIEHVHAHSLRDRHGEPDPDTRIHAIRHRLGNGHATGDINGNADGERDSPGIHGDVHPNRHAAAALTHITAAYAHADAGHADGTPHPNDCADETSAGVDLAS